jgi:hypothetical protein
LSIVKTTKRLAVLMIGFGKRTAQRKTGQVVVFKRSTCSKFIRSDAREGLQFFPFIQQPYHNEFISVFFIFSLLTLPTIGRIKKASQNPNIKKGRRCLHLSSDVSFKPLL